MIEGGWGHVNEIHQKVKAVLDSRNVYTYTYMYEKQSNLCKFIPRSNMSVEKGRRDQSRNYSTECVVVVDNVWLLCYWKFGGNKFCRGIKLNPKNYTANVIIYRNLISIHMHISSYNFKTNESYKNKLKS